MREVRALKILGHCEHLYDTRVPASPQKAKLIKSLKKTLKNTALSSAVASIFHTFQLVFALLINLKAPTVDLPSMFREIYI